MRIAVLGSGAMGAIFGSALARSGADVMFFDKRPDVVEAICRSGLEVDGVSGKMTKCFPATTDSAALGKIDIALVPVDGSYTLDLPGMVEVIKALHARLVIPMHYFSTSGLSRFLDRIGSDFPVRHSATAQYVASKAILPQQTEILVLPGN